MSRTFFKKFSTMICIPLSIIPLLLEMPLQAFLSRFKPLSWQYLILKWTTRAWHAVVASHRVSCALETRTQFLHRIFTIISTIPSQLYLVRYLFNSSLTSSILSKYQDPIFSKRLWRLCESPWIFREIWYSDNRKVNAGIPWITTYCGIA